MEPSERRIMIVTCAGHFASHFNMLVFPALVLPLAQRLGLDMARVLGLSFWMYLLFGVTALPWGVLADRWGADRLMLLFFLGSGLSGLGAVFWMDSPAGFSLALTGIGLFTGIYHPVGLGLISKGVTRVSLAMGVNGMFGAVGLALAPVLAGVLNWLWGPRAVYLTLAAANLAGAGIAFLLPLGSSKHRESAETVEGNGLLGAFPILLVAMTLGGIAYRGATVVLPAYFEIKNQGILGFFSDLLGRELSGNLVATAVASLIYLVSVLAQYTGGRVATRFEPRWAYLAFNVISMPAVFLMASTRDLPLVFLALVYFFFLLGMQPIENTLVARLTPHRFHHSAYGLKFILTFGVGALAVQMAGWIERAWGIEATFPALGVVSLALILSVVCLIRQTRAAGLSPESVP